MSQTSLKLSSNHLGMIRAHIESQPNEEVCGLIGGTWSPYPLMGLAREIVPVPNIAEQRAVRYLMKPAAQASAILAFERQGWQVVGIYHSHPGGQPFLSPTDIAEISYPDALYLVGVPGGDLLAWRIQRGMIMPFEIVVEE